MLHSVLPGKLQTVSGGMSSSSQRKPWSWRVPVHSSMFFLYTPVEAGQTQTQQHDRHLLLYISTSFRIEDSDPFRFMTVNLNWDYRKIRLKKSVHWNKH